MLNTTSYSFAASVYPDNVDKVIGLLESVAGIGCVCGPVLGSFIYDLVGFQWTFMGFGIAMAPTAFLATLLKNPSEVKVDKNTEEEEDNALDFKQPIVGAPAMIVENSSKELRKLSYGNLICNARVIFAALTVGFNCLVYCVFEPTLSLRL